MASYLPPGWPPAVDPPGSDGFEASAVAWLLDCLPPGFREHQRVHRYPVAVATIARHHAEASVAGARQGYRVIRRELDGVASPEVVDAVLAAYRVEGKRLAADARAVALVERALRGEAFVPSL